MKFIFADGSAELALPITPKSFEVGSGIKIEIVNIHTIGDVAVGGYGTLGEIKIECVFPSSGYRFAQKLHEPYEYVEKFKNWCGSRTVLRLIITGTSVNIPVMLSNISYGERDGTGDVYATLSMREYKYISAASGQKSAMTQNYARPDEMAPPPAANTYAVASGDTLPAIARKYYGDESLHKRLAAYNGISADLIYPGQIIMLPDKKWL